MGKKSISDAGPRLKAMNDALAGFDQMRAEIERLRSQPCPYVTGNVTRYCTLTPFTLTDAEREALEQAVAFMQGSGWSASTLRGLLERCSQFAKRESDRPQPIAKRDSDRPKPIAHTPPTQTTPGEGSKPDEGTSEPVAWWLRGTEYDTGCEYEYVSLLKENAEAAAAEGGTVVPLYRAPTLTDAEREAVELAYSRLTADPYWSALATTLRGLLERTAQNKTDGYVE